MKRGDASCSEFGEIYENGRKVWFVCATNLWVKLLSQGDCLKM